MPGGKGNGQGRGAGQGQGTSGGGIVRMGGNRPGIGPGGNCVCPSCGTTVPHQTGVPCNTVDCPKCGSQMTRQ